MTCYIGIDPSMNSTGISIIKEAGEHTSISFYIIKPDLTKKERQNEQNLNDVLDSSFYFKYVIYDKLPTDNEDNHISEYCKTVNMTRIMKTIRNIVYDECKNSDENYIVQEGISYGSSLRTKSVYDLAGLNYMLRQQFINAEPTYDDKFKMIIATPQNIKKFATGKGNAKKEDIIANFVKDVSENFTILKKVDDISDAYYMARYAKTLHEEDKYKEIIDNF